APVRADILDEVVRDPHPVQPLTFDARELEAGVGATNVIVDEGDVLDRRPRHPAIWVAYREEHRPPLLRPTEDDRIRWPGVCEQVAVDEQALSVVELEEVFDAPDRAGEGRIAGAPRSGLVEMVPTDLDVGRDRTGDAGEAASRPSDEDIL